MSTKPPCGDHINPLFSHFLVKAGCCLHDYLLQVCHPPAQRFDLSYIVCFVLPDALVQRILQLGPTFKLKNTRFAQTCSSTKELPRRFLSIKRFSISCSI
eukprot:TRINITY_DN15578_c0_g5_i1.p1 TRINITY_DN15578_c0_g5~~TRINITY_DN15578_c0_g5_i1.p1  ORF type:complete len:100 (-),score=5.77 TRINITY_DN15578_c0_g5_i1:312-611(-)